MSLWCDKYRPHSFGDLEYNTEQADKLKTLVKNKDFPHILIYGPSGAGKKTRIRCLLRELFGTGVERLRMDIHQIETPSKKKIELRTISSNFHIEVNPSDVGIYDRIALMELVKETAGTRTLNEKAPFTVFIITEADKMTRDAQQGLRRTMEKYSANCRFILTGDTSSRIIPAIRSRCLMVRVPAPTPEQIQVVLESVIKKQRIVPKAVPDLTEIASNCDRNLRRALMMLESMCLSTKPKLVQPKWLEFIKAMSKKIVQNQSPKMLEEIRNDYFELQSHLIPPEIIFRHTLNELLAETNKHLWLHAELVRLAAFYEHKIRLGSKSVIHFEAFTAHAMLAIRKQKEKAPVEQQLPQY